MNCKNKRGLWRAAALALSLLTLQTMLGLFAYAGEGEKSGGTVLTTGVSGEENRHGNLLQAGSTPPLFSELVGAESAKPTEMKINEVDALNGGDVTIPADRETVSFSAKYSFVISKDKISGGAIAKNKTYNLGLPPKLLPPGGPTSGAEFKVTDTEDGSKVQLGTISFSSEGAFLTFDYPDFTDDKLNDYLTAIGEGGIQSCTISLNWSKSQDEINTGNNHQVSIPLYGTTLTLKFDKHRPSDPVTMVKTGKALEADSLPTGQVQWTVTITPDRNTDTGVVFTDTFANQTYVADSFKINGGVPVSNVTLGTGEPGKLTCTFTNALNSYAASSGKIILTYTTEATDDAYGDSFAESIAVKNDAILTKSGTTAPLCTATATVTINTPWLTKQGVVTTGQTRSNTKRIKWTLTLNPTGRGLSNVTVHDQMAPGLILDTNSVKIVSPTQSSVASSEISFKKSDGNASNDGSGVTFEFTLASVTEKTVITYETTFTDEFFTTGGGNTAGAKVENKAWITFIYKSGSWTSGNVSAEVGVGEAPITKSGSYNRATHEITWKIIVNSVGANLTNCVVTDIIPDGQTYVTGSANPAPNIDGQKLTFNLDNGANGCSATITYKTTVNNENDWAYNNAEPLPKYSNKATLGASLNGATVSGNAPADVSIPSNVLKKSLGDYNYATKTIPCTLTVNENKMPMSNGAITDTLSEGLSLPDGAVLTVTGAGGVSSISAGSGVDAAPYYTYDTDSRKLVIHLGALANEKTVTITFDLKVDVDHYGVKDDKTTQEKFTLKNIAELSRTDHTNKKVEVSAQASDINAAILDKKGDINNSDGTIAYSVLINKLGLDLDGLGASGTNYVTDTMSTDVSLDLESVKLYAVTVDEDGKCVESSKQEVAKSGYAVIYTPGSDKNVLKVTLPQNSGSKIYQLDYTVFVLATGTTNITNKIAFNAEAAKAAGTENSNVDIGSDGGGWLSRMALIKLQKKNAGGGALSGATFAIYKADDSTMPVSTAVSDANGKVQFVVSPGPDYLVKETRAPDGYKIAKEWADGKVAKRDGNTGSNYKWEDAGTSTKTDIREVVNVTETGSITFAKKDDLGDVVPGAEYTLYKDDSPYGAPAVSDASGNVAFKDIPAGTYTLKESKAPDTHDLSATVYTVVMSESGTVTSFVGAQSESMIAQDGSVTITNKVKRGNLSVTKVAAENEAKLLPGAVFQVTDAAHNKTYGPATTDETGKATIEDLPFGVPLTLTETAAPNGYQIAAPRTFTLSEGDFAEPTEAGDFEITVADTLTPPKPDPVVPGTTDPDDDDDYDNPGRTEDPKPKDPKPKPPETPEVPVPETPEPQTPPETDQPIEEGGLEIPPDAEITIVEPPEHGTVIFDPDGGWKFYRDPGYTGSDTFTVAVTLPDGTQQLYTIPMEPIPLAGLPQTGGTGPLLWLAIGGTLILLGGALILLSRKKRI